MKSNTLYDRLFGEEENHIRSHRQILFRQTNTPSQNPSQNWKTIDVRLNCPPCYRSVFGECRRFGWGNCSG